VKATKAQQKALGLPPAWTGVLINPDPKGKLVAIGYDAAGRRQPRYSEEHHREKAASKHGRVSAFGKSLPGLRKQIDKDHETSDEAVILDLIDKTSFRKGSDRDTKAKVKAYGASTLLDEHVKIRGNDVHFDFIAKEGTRVQKTITDARLAKALKARKAASDGGKLFPSTNEKKLAAYMTAAAPGFTPKDFRTWNGTKEALQIIKGMPVPKTAKELKRARLEVGEKVGAILGHTEKGGGKIALKSYINPAVFSKWEGKK
jgi:DNA topoisomerase-1